MATTPSSTGRVRHAQPPSVSICDPMITRIPPPRVGGEGAEGDRQRRERHAGDDGRGRLARSSTVLWSRGGQPAPATRQSPRVRSVGGPGGDTARSRPRGSRGERPFRSLSTQPPRHRGGPGAQVGKRHRRIRALSTTGSVAGAAKENSGLSAHQPMHGLPNLRSPKGPYPGDRTVRPPPDSNPGGIFMPGKLGHCVGASSPTPPARPW